MALTKEQQAYFHLRIEGILRDKSRQIAARFPDLRFGECKSDATRCTNGKRRITHIHLTNERYYPKKSHINLQGVIDRFSKGSACYSYNEILTEAGLAAYKRYIAKRELQLERAYAEEDRFAEAAKKCFDHAMLGKHEEAIKQIDKLESMK